MHGLFRIRALAALAALSLSAVPVFASVSSSVQVTGFTVNLIDLDPSDGIAPSVTFYTGSLGDGEVTASAGAPPMSTFQLTADFFAPMSASVGSDPAQSASAFVSGDPYAGSGAIGASAVANPVTSQLTANSGATAKYGNGFFLSANTVMIITAQAALNTSVTDGMYAANDTATAGVSFDLQSYTATGTDDSKSGFSLLDSNQSYPGGAQSESGNLVVSVYNATSDDLSGNFMYNVNATAVATVPEAGSTLMMLAGLAVLGAVAVRRRGVKSRTPRARTLLAALGLAVGAVPAFADESASVQVTGLTITLYDLNPNDGIAPSIVFNQSEQQPSSAEVYTDGGFNDTEAYGNGVFGATSATFTPPHPGVTGTAAVAGDPFSGTGSLTAMTSLTHNNSLHVNSTHADSSDGYYLPTFTLSAGTLMVVTEDVALNTSITSPGGFNQFAEATSTLELSGPGPAGNGSQASDHVADLQSGNGASGGPTKSENLVMTASFLNYSNASMVGTFVSTVQVEAEVSTLGAGPVRAVPEPSGGLLGLAGLAALGLQRRRRGARA